MLEKIVKTEDEWFKELGPDRYAVLRQGATEAPFTGEYDSTFDKGMYVCAACNAPLFSSDAKYDSGCGWPAFWDSANQEAIERVPDHSLGMARVEIKCARCGSHLGHVFPDGPKDKTGERFCVNSASLKLKKD